MLQVTNPVELDSALTGVHGRSSNSSTGESFATEAKEYARKLREIDEELENAAQFIDRASMERFHSERE